MIVLLLCLLLRDPSLVAEIPPFLLDRFALADLLLSMDLMLPSLDLGLDLDLSRPEGWLIRPRSNFCTDFFLVLFLLADFGPPFLSLA